MYSSLVKKVLRRSYKLIGRLPAKLRVPIIRSQLKLNYSYIPGIKIKVAESKDEIEQAYKILHDTYLETKLIDEETSGLRVTKYHALPTTTLCVVKHFDKVIGTFTIIQDSIFGLPIDATSDITELRKRNSKIAEISSLAIAKDSGLRRGKLMFPVINFIHLYCQEVGNINALVAVVNDTAKFFYEDIICFKPLSVKEEANEYSYVKHNGINPLALEFKYEKNDNFANEMKNNYRNYPIEKNVYHYMYVYRDRQHVELPEHDYPLTSHNSIDPETVREYFKNRTSTFEQLSSDEKNALKKIYGSPIVIRETGVCHSGPESSRANMRFPTSLRSDLVTGNLLEKNYSQIIEASMLGAAIFTEKKMNVGELVIIKTVLNGKEVKLKANVIWENSEFNRYGILFKGEIPKEWLIYNDYLRQAYYPSLTTNYIENEEKVVNLRIA